MKILAVDNDPLMLKFYRKILEKHELDYQTAQDGLSALKVLKSFIPDVILLDMVMPNINGKKLCKIIRTKPILKSVKIVFVSAVAMEEQFTIDDVGADGLIAKGTFSAMESHILEALVHLKPDPKAEQINQENYRKIRGLEDQRVRAITKELIHSQKHFEIILQNMSEGLIEFNTEFKIVYVNPAAIILTGVSEEKLLGSNLLDLFAVAKQREIKSNIRAEINQGGSYFDDTPLEINGRNYYLTILPVKVNGKLSIIAILKDVTTRMEIIERLQHVIKMESIGTLAGGIAHDFNNLMMGIQGNLSVLLLDVNYTHPHYNNLKRIQSIVKSAARLTEQLIGYARKGKYDPKKVNFNDIILDSSEMFGRTKKNIVIQREFAENLYAVEVDRAQIEQVLINLYVNAMQAMPEGGRLLLRTSNASDKDMQCQLYRPKAGKYALLEVCDSGIGMDENLQKRIFDPFFSTKDLGRGTGLGLASAYGIIKNHSGYIEVESEKGEGTTFKIFLPAVGEGLPSDLKETAVTAVKEVILLVDDEEMVLDSGEKMLRILDYDVITASGGKAALETYKLRQEDIDMVILDMVMPDMGGDEVYKKLREIDPDAKVLISSGYSIDGLPEGFSVDETAQFLHKPFGLKELYKQTRETLDVDISH